MGQNIILKKNYVNLTKNTKKDKRGQCYITMSQMNKKFIIKKELQDNETIQKEDDNENYYNDVQTYNITILDEEEEHQKAKKNII